MTRGFARAEYAGRLKRAQDRMAQAGLSALLLTTEADVRWFTGFLTRFWESPTRPWFLVVPVEGDPVAVIPSIGAELMGRTWVTDIRTWPAPDPEDDGVSLLAAALRETGGRIGVPMGLETRLRMPLDSLDRVRAAIAPAEIVADRGVMRALRAVKSEAEVAKIEAACAVAGRAFARVGEIAGEGVQLSEVFRRFQVLALEEGADWVPYLAGGAGGLGYGDVISPASDAPLQAGDVLMLDTGLVVDGYFCDFDRNYTVGTPDPRVTDAWSKLLEATAAGEAALTPGARACDVFHAMDRVLGGGTGAGRLGHGLGMQLTEGLSLIAADDTELQPGMVLTLEPGIAVADGAILVHEDDYVVTETGARRLSPQVPRQLPAL